MTSHANASVFDDGLKASFLGMGRASPVLQLKSSASPRLPNGPSLVQLALTEPSEVGRSQGMNGNRDN